MNKKENNFFKKVWHSITKFEQYPDMAVEGLKKAIKYLVTLTAIVTVFVAIGTVLQMKTIIKDLSVYIQDNIPDFSYTNGKISMENQETIVLEDINDIGVEKIVINTSAETDEQKQEIENENVTIGTMILFYNNEIILKNQTDENNTIRQEYTYNDFIASYMGENIETFNKQDLVSYLTSKEMISFYTKYGISVYLYMLIVNIIVMLLNSLEIAILGWITSTLARIKIRFVAIYNMAIYSLTLPIILNVIYIITNYFIDFTITYFQVAYITISYIYLAAAIFILKDDLIKKMQEVEKIKQTQVKVREEIEKEQERKESENEDKKENKKDKKNENKDTKDNEENDEPQGSEA